MSRLSITKVIRALPEQPGVYYMKDARGTVVYVGKAGNLRRRVSSYFQKVYPERSRRTHDGRIEHLVSEIATIDFQTTPSVLEALILEANEIRRLMPKYNVRERDDKSYLYLVFTRDEFPKPELVRGRELAKFGERHFLAVYGPYLSASSIRAALQILRKIFPYSTCEPGQKRPCFYHHLKLCPGVCVGAIAPRAYRKIIRQLGMVFAGKKLSVLHEMKREMTCAAKDERFEEATKLRNKIFALEHIQDVAVLTRDERPHFGRPSLGHPERSEGSPTHVGERTFARDSSAFGLRMTESAINIFGRVEGYDISNISGVESVGSMVVFEGGEPRKSEYRKFKIKTVSGINDVAMMKEVLLRRFKHLNAERSTLNAWRKPDLILIDGGWGQVHGALEVLAKYHLNIPIIGIAKGFKRKQDQPIYDKQNVELARIVGQYKEMLLQVRDEAHRFAILYHRKRMRRRLSER